MSASYTSTTVWTGAGDGTNWNDPANWTDYDGQGNATPRTQAPGSSGWTGSITLTGTETIDMGDQTWSAIGTVIVADGANVTLKDGALTPSSGYTISASATLALSGAGAKLSSTGSVQIDGALKLEGGASVGLNNNVSGTIVFGDAPDGTHNTLTELNTWISVANVQNFKPGDSIVVQPSSYKHIRWIQQGSSNTYTLVAYDGNTTMNAIARNVTFAARKNADGSVATDASGATLYYSPLDLSPAPTATGTIDGKHNDAAYTGNTYYQDAGLAYNDSSTPTATVTCFLAGSMIRTAKGDVAVEDVRVGDLVLTVTAGREVYQPVIWAGYQTATVRADLPDDEAGYPVRIRAGALAEGVPYKDLLITPEHCLFLNGRFVPVRMLVNGRSIFYDRTLTQYTYYHVETAQHAVIMANGMLTESYLDTGNRGTFAQAGKVATLGAGPRSWAQHAAVPLAVAREEVEPMFRALAARAAQSGNGEIRGTEAGPELTYEAGLHLETMCGQTIRKIRMQDGLASFMLPAGVTQVRLVSRASRPCDVVGPFVDDRRMLGVLVGDIVMCEGNLAPRSIVPQVQDSTLPGWHAPEPNGARWTNGSAVLPVPTSLQHALTVLTVRVLSAGPYCVEDTSVCRDCVNH
ncbi:outer membrane protein [Acetobacter malorum]|uniref:Outer membrane protein n=1 Tax=Acetobacter malorum TaxID=178901 RepID=A0A177G7N7_9PROT|nr:Hint domain-containing protein [Acetobacter malorum]OAG75385.1 outer membrane protein [Acetobacter malorum]